MKTRKTTHEVITEHFINCLNEDVIPWRKPWGTLGSLKNIKGNAYKGINAMILNCTPHESKIFLTYKQAKELGGNVKKGEKGYPVTFWKIGKYEELNEETNKLEEKKSFILKYYTVFNIEQCENLILPKKVQEELLNSRPEQLNQIDKIELCEQIIKGYKDCPQIKHTSNNSAYYTPTKDYVNMPYKKSFNDAEFYYSVLFHELAHSTGHSSRLDRKLELNHGFGSHEYSKEELIAEITASFLYSECELDTEKLLTNSKAYIKSWIKVLKSNPKYIIEASSKAEKAYNYIRNIQKPENKD